MSKKLSRILIAFQIVLIFLGAGVAAKPAYNYCLWKIRQATGRLIWEYSRHHSNNSRIIYSPAAWLAIPDADIQSLVIQNAAEEDLIKFPCLFTSAPGNNNKKLKLIMAHRDKHFRNLKDIRVSHPIQLEMIRGREKLYTIVETEILSPEKARSRLIEKSHEDWLVLMTCYPFYYVGPAPDRFLVWAKETDDLT